MAKLNTISKNLNAFLDTIAYAEGTSTSSLTRDDGYDVIVTGVGGKEIFSDYSRHPFVNRKAKDINGKGLFSSASGRYQHMRVHWEHYRDLLHLPDFGPESQDRWAIQLIRERKALPLIEHGDFEMAIKTVANLWASLPGANYAGQPMRSMKVLKEVYLAKGGELWESKLSSAESSPHLPQSSVPLSLENTKAELKPNQKPVLNEPTKTQGGLWNLLKNLLKLN